MPKRKPKPPPNPSGSSDGPRQQSIAGTAIPEIEKASEAWEERKAEAAIAKEEARSAKAMLDQAVLDAVKAGKIKPPKKDAGTQKVYGYTGDDYENPGRTVRRAVRMTVATEISTLNEKDEE